MKKIVLLIGISLILMIVFTVMFKVNFAKQIIVSKNSEILIPLLTKVEGTDTHGGFHMDGETFYKIYLSDNQCEKVIKKIKNNNHWKSFPMTENAMRSLPVLKNGPEYYPKIQNGYWFFIDKHSEADDIYDENERFNEKRYSNNYAITMLDTDTKIIYYYQYDS